MRLRFELFWLLVLTGTPKDVIRTESLSTAAAEQMENVYETVERMPHLWQGAEYPLETILTTYAIYTVVFRCRTQAPSVAMLPSHRVLNPVTHCGPIS